MDRMTETGPWDGTRTAAPHVDAPDSAEARAKGTVVLETWRQMIDDGRGQDGQPKYHATARPAVLRASAATLKAAGIMPGGRATIGTDDGSATFTTEVADLPDGVVWAPANNGTNLRTIRAGHGSDRSALRGRGRWRRMSELFGNEPFWVVALKAVLIFVFLVVYTLFNIWFERRVVARMQHRIGPNVHGPFGLLQSLADGVKLALKEDIVVKAADKVVYVAAPILATIPAFLAWAVIPFGPEVTIPFTDTVTPLQLTDLPVAVLYILAVTSIGIYGIVLAGWSSGSIYALLGGMRSSAQMISYEVAMGLSFVSVFMYAGSMSTSEIVAAQTNTWYFLPLFPSFVIYVIAMVGETNRAPFDLPEAEGELVGGFHTEYSSLKFALFFLAEYVNMVTVSALATTLFLGGWRAPFGIAQVWEGAN